MLLFIIVMGMQISYAAQQVLDVVVTENAYHVVTYSPQPEITSGLWADQYEVVSVFTFTGTINVTNLHSTVAVENILLNFTQAGNVSGIAFSSGRNGIVTDYTNGQSYATLLIPDLGPGQSTIFTYNVNTTNIAPPLNMSTEYNDEKVLSGDSFTVTDRLSNTLSSALHPSTCIYDINITQIAVQLNNSGEFLNFTFDRTIGISGHDANNASIYANNLTLQWNVLNSTNGRCLSAGETTNITYTVQSPPNVVTANNYAFSNATIYYRVDTAASRLNFNSISAIADLDLNFEKEIFSLHQGDNATWRVAGNISSEHNVTVNVTFVSFWVSERNGNGGFTNPGNLTNDTVDRTIILVTNYTPGQLINNSLPVWSSRGSDWFFNYTYSSSPVVWMDLESELYINDGVQLANRTVTFGQNKIYTKEIYVVTGYFIEITRNITRLTDNNFTIFIEVTNRGTSSTPADQVVVVYNFIDDNFTLTSNFTFSTSSWYNTLNTSTQLTDPIYSGRMHQFALMPTSNPYNSSLNEFGGAQNANNTWNVSYNLTGVGEFAFDDLFLTGVDPLHVKEIGGTKALKVENNFKVESGSGEYVLIGVAALVSALLLVF